MKTKKTLFIGLMIFAFTSVVMAQKEQSQSTEERVKQQTEQMVKDLNLTEDQIPTVEKINQKYAEKMETVRDQNQGNRENMRSEMRQLFEDRDAELKKVLTNEQFEIYKKKQEERRAQRRNKRGGGR
jgi:Spy/CpxP family protein refolding chaperone